MAQTQVAIPEKIFFKIGEVCDIVEVQAHVLRYWETEFPMLSPQKNRSGQRTYRRRDVEIALQIKDLLYEDLYTIAGAKKRLQNEMRETSRLKIVRTEPKDEQIYIKAVEEPIPIEEQELKIKDVGEESAENLSLSDDEDFEMDDERREALKSLASQLLELREMLKPNQIQN
ncbi:MAG: MerR family transcriptional regulator [Acidobacteriota bacterium]|nr:MerR family transcriptional regulator [Acidobacteriota bacterium]